MFHYGNWGFAWNIVFSRVHGGSGAEKSRLARHGHRRRRFAVESCSKSARTGTEGSRWLVFFFVAAVNLCFACVETLCALEVVHQSDVFYSSVLQVFCAWQLSLCRSQWNGCVRVSRCCGCERNTIVFCSWESQIVMTTWQLRMVLWQQIFWILVVMNDFPSFQNSFQKCFKIISI